MNGQSRTYDYNAIGYWGCGSWNDRHYVLGFENGFIIYQWSPLEKKLTRWHAQSWPGFGNLPRVDRTGVVEMTLRKVLNGTPVKKQIADKAAQQRWPELWQHLTATAYPDGDGGPRSTSTITLFSRDDGSLGATLNDRDNSRACFASADTLMGLFDALERVAGHPDTAWREDRQQTGSSKRKK